MGVVWHARDSMLGRDVAVKEVLCPGGLTALEQQVLFRRTVREARAAARLHHPAVVTVFDVIEEDGRPWIVMEFIASRSLAQAIHEDGPLPPGETARVGLQVLGALTSAHAAGILHRDVKPGNVLLGADGRVVLTDFGIATLQGDATLTPSSGVIGSPAYIAPERTRGGPAQPASDLWSLGITLYAAVEGRTPYERDGALPTLFAVATEAPDPPRQAGPLTPVLEGLLRQDPATRLSADDTRLLLRAAAADPAVRPGSAISAPAIPAPASWTDPASGARTQEFTQAGRAPGASSALPSTAALPGAGHLPVPATGGPDDPGRRPPRRGYIAALPALVGLAALIMIAVLLLVPGRNASGRPHRPGTSPGAAAATSSGRRASSPRASSPGPSASPARASSPAGATSQPTTTSPASPPDSPSPQGPAQGPKPKKAKKPKKT